MLQEVLLALSGHPSPLFNNTYHDSQSQEPPFSLLTPAENALLQPLGLLATLHHDIRAQATQISSRHPSIVCRAVATAIISTQLAKFQDKILQIERDILREDSSVVGAYGIVPLATIVAAFDGWERRLKYLWDLTCYMLPVNDERFQNVPSGSYLINKLRDDSLTGYPDIESICQDLIADAERAWLRQLATWLLYGKLVENARYDFLIHKLKDSALTNDSDLSDNPWHVFNLDHSKIPLFVTPDTASSILFIGRSLNQLKTSDSRPYTSDIRPSLITEHLGYLVGLTSPISAAQMTSAIRSIRQSLSRNVINGILPIERTIQTIQWFKDFLLLGRRDFASALVSQADAYLRSRQLQSQNTSRDLAGIVMKGGEVELVLAKTWTELAASCGPDEDMDEALDWAREHLHLHIYKPSHAPKAHDDLEIGQDQFHDFLLSTPTVLSLDLPPNHNLFFSNQDLKLYSFISNYLIAIRRAHLRLTDLWRRERLRKNCIGPKNTRLSQAESKESEKVSTMRSIEMRAVWATATSAVSVLTILIHFLNGEVVEESWKQFHEFVVASEGISNDPETLSTAHQQYLHALVSSLLLNNTTYTRTVRQLLVRTDQFIGFLDRLVGIWSLADAQDTTRFQADELDIKSQLQTSCKLLQTDIRDLVIVLRNVDEVAQVSDSVHELSLPIAQIFQPWRGNGVDRLLMRLDNGDITEAETSGTS